MKAKNKTKKLVKVTYSVGDYITFKTIFGLNEGRIVKVIDESWVSVNTIDGFMTIMFRSETLSSKLHIEFMYIK